ncbi:MAG: hypothetical protein JXM70_26545 [Pirellulales bacterium]|nr:hypothetical protein [Pirellulales bacterium]
MDATLLIYDVKSLSRDALESLFLGCGFRVETAGDGLECMDKLRSLHPDLLMADMEAPWGGAAAVVAFLHESCFEFDMPDILVLGNVSPKILSQRTGVPEPSCFQRPLHMEKMLDRVGLTVALLGLNRFGQVYNNDRLADRSEKTEVCFN